MKPLRKILHLTIKILQKCEEVLCPDIVKNVFKKNNAKKVLISYITAPFTDGLSKKHTNNRECWTAAAIFDELGYNVDVVDISFTGKLDYTQYDVLYGMSQPLENSFKSQNDCVKIAYSTGFNPPASNNATLKKLRTFRKETGIQAFSSVRYISLSEDMNYLLSDAVIVLGNEYTQKTFTAIDSECAARYKKLNAFYYPTCNIDVQKKDFAVAKKHFLWFGSTGALHKGLDVLINIFLRQSEYVLHICGASPKEKAFWDYFQPKIESAPNIVNHGFVDIESSEFKTLMETCAFAVYPTVSEGCCTALLAVIANGALIPICSKATGLDIEDGAFIVNNITEKDFEDAILHAAALSQAELLDRASRLKQNITTNYTYEGYRRNLKTIITDILQEHGK